MIGLQHSISATALWLLVLFTYTFIQANTKKAIVLTLTGSDLLAPYFEWSCRTFAYVGSDYHMLIFHESNKKLASIKCANNVEFIDLGPDGLAKAIGNTFASAWGMDDLMKEGLISRIADIKAYATRYLVEVKPMTGDIFREYLKTYTHWSYTDPDIIWGNVSNWLSDEDIKGFDVVTIATNNDAGRLFVRGQFALHKNVESLNTLWKQLPHLKQNSVEGRLGSAERMQKSGKTSTQVGNVFVSAEGFYSGLLFKSVRVKIVSRGLWDHDAEPVVWYRGRLTRVSRNMTTSMAIQRLKAGDTGAQVGQHMLPGMVQKVAEVHRSNNNCHLRWLPSSIRYCVSTIVNNDKYKADAQGGLLVDSVGEIYPEVLAASHTADGPRNDSYLYDGVALRWVMNDERAAPRQVADRAAFYHFRVWADVRARKGSFVHWGYVDAANSLEQRPELGSDCMVMSVIASRLRFENCDSTLGVPMNFKTLKGRQMKKKKRPSAEQLTIKST